MGKNVKLSIDKNGIAEIVFDSEGKEVNVLNEETMSELEQALHELKNNKFVKVAILKSAKKSIFIAGADIGEIAGIKTADDARAKVKRGQDIITKIEMLQIPTIAVINGACLGGGLELALAAKFRIVSDSKAVKLGLPEVNLGVLPGFGGTIRLQRLIGVTEALKMILPGKIIDAKKAVKIKLSDKMFPEAFLDDMIAEFVHELLNSSKKKELLKKRSRKSLGQKLLEGTPPGRMIIFSKAKKDLLKQTRGFYPAPVEALKTVRKNSRANKKAFIREQDAFAKLVLTNISKKLINIFFLNEELKKYYDTGVKDKGAVKHFKQAAVLGAGTMGGAISWLFSNAGIPVRMKDISWNAINAGIKTISDFYSILVKRKKIEKREADLNIQKVSGITDYSGLGSCDVVIEAIIEDKDIKIKTLKEAEDISGNETIIATNTSSYSVEELSSGLKNPERFAGFHFFNPVNRMPLIEIVRGKKTSEDTLQKLVLLARTLKKTPILVNDCHGFLVNRILVAYLNEAIMMLEEGHDFKLIDSVIFEFGFPMGPFTIMDEIGIKTGYKIAKNMMAAYPERNIASNVFDEIGKLDNVTGKHGGSGFYIYITNNSVPNKQIYDILKKFKLKAGYKITTEEIIERCMLRMINEATLCLQENIIDKPGFLDMALIMGIGFPPFRGGVLSYADDIGIDTVVNGLKKYEAKYGSRFRPADLLTKMKENKERFYK